MNKWNLENELILTLKAKEKHRQEIEKEAGVTPLPELIIVRSFLHLRPAFVLRKTDVTDDYSINRLWPEVLLLMDEHQAEKLKIWLIKAYNFHQSRQPDYNVENNILEIRPYVVENYSDEEFYSMIHRVPASIRNLKTLEKNIGLQPARNIIEV